MPTFSYICRKDRGGCGNRFKARKSVISWERVTCPSCDTNWQARKKLRDGTRVSVIERVVPEKPVFADAAGHEVSRPVPPVPIEPTVVEQEPVVVQRAVPKRMTLDDFRKASDA